MKNLENQLPLGRIATKQHIAALRIVLLAIALLAITPLSHATIFYYTVNLNGPSESPSNASPGTGFGTVDYDSTHHLLAVSLSFSGLTGTTTASHIHAPTVSPFSGTAGVATTTPTFAGFPLGVTSGTYNNTLDLTLSSSYNPAYVTANGGTTASAEAALASAMATGRAYWNVHTTTFPGGEIRGFLVPEPSSMALLGLGAGAVAWTARRRKAS
jgi:CHRD domain-containing protein/PEP-CTERM motif-containing protein